MPMPFLPSSGLAGMYGAGAPSPPAFGMQQQAPLLLADLYTPVEQVDYPSAPQLPGDVGDLSAQDQQKLRRDMILQTLFGALSNQRSGNAGVGALQGLLSARAQQSQAVDDARREAMQQYQVQRQQAEQDARGRQAQVLDAKQRQEAESLLGTYHSVLAAAQQAGARPELMATFDSQARSLAKAGDDAALQKLLASVPKAVRFDKAAQDAGFDASDPLARQQYEEQQKRDIQLDYEKKLIQARAAAEAQFRQPPPSQMYTDPTTGQVFLVGRDGNATPVQGPAGPLGGRDMLRQKAVDAAMAERQKLLAAGEPPPNLNARVQQFMTLYSGGTVDPAPPAVMDRAAAFGQGGPPPAAAEALPQGLVEQIQTQPRSGAPNVPTQGIQGPPVAAAQLQGVLSNIRNPKALAWAQTQLANGASPNAVMATLLKFQNSAFGGQP